MTLHDLLEAAIKERLAVAQAAPPGPWSTSGPDTIAEWTVYDRHWAVAEARTYNEPTTIMPFLPRPETYIDANATAAHIAANGPARIIRDCERDLRVLARHSPFVPHYWPDCLGCSNCSTGGLTGEMEVWPCEDIRDLAEAYGIEVTE